MRDTISVRLKDNPVMLDRVLQDIQHALKSKLTWLDNVFGKSFKLIDRGEDGDKFMYPAIYVGHGEYVSVLPNDRFGNFSWFDIYDPQEVIDDVQLRPQLVFNGAIVFWYNISSIYDDDSVLYTEDIKNEILRVLTAPGVFKSSSKLTVNRVYESPENIYRGYALEKIYSDSSIRDKMLFDADKQYFMYPYAGLRIEFTIKTRELC